MQLRAVALNGLGEVMTGTEMRWSMADTQAGTIDGRGIFIAGDAPGIFTEAVQVEAILPGEPGIIRAADFASVVVQGGHVSKQLESVNVTPRSVVVNPGGRALLMAQPSDASGGVAEDVSVSWQTTHKDVGQIDAYGNFRAGAVPGSYPNGIQVIVRQELGEDSITRTQSADVTITGTLTELQMHPILATVKAGGAIHFDVTGRDENWVVLPGLVVLWSVSDESIGTIDHFGNFIAGDVTGLYEDAVHAEVIQNLSGGS